MKTRDPRFDPGRWETHTGESVVCPFCGCLVARALTHVHVDECDTARAVAGARELREE